LNEVLSEETRRESQEDGALDRRIQEALHNGETEQLLRLIVRLAGRKPELAEDRLRELFDSTASSFRPDPENTGSDSDLQFIRIVPSTVLDEQIQASIDGLTHRQAGFREGAVGRLLEHTMTESRERIQNNRLQEATRLVQQLPDTPPGMAQVKCLLHARNDELEEIRRLHQQIDVTITTAKQLLKSRQFDQARKCIGVLPDKLAGFEKLKAELRRQIDGAEDRDTVKDSVIQRTRQVFERVKKLVDQRKFSDARQEVECLRDHPHELKQLRTHLLNQIGEAEQKVAGS
jgi:hypothetical protein